MTVNLDETAWTWATIWVSRTALRQSETPQICEFHPITELACQIKRKVLTNRHVDPDVRIQVPGTEESISVLICRGKLSKSKTVLAYPTMWT